MIQLKDVQPIPLKETPGGIRSDSNIFGTNCAFEKGKNYLISAPSGKGKSTLLHLIYGLRKDFTGAIDFEEKDVLTFSREEWSDIRQQKFSIVFQDLRLFPELTALENMTLKADLTNAKSEAEIISMAERLGIANLLHQKAKTLSYGQRQRVAIIRALCQPFDFLFLDEPFSHLDEENAKNASELITEICKAQSAGILLVSLGDRYYFQYDEEKIL